MAGAREWFKHDAWFLADDKIRDLGHEFGAAGPLVAEAILELAKRQKAGGRVTVKWTYLAEHAFVAGRGVVQRIVAEAEGLGLFDVEERNERRVVVFLPKWQQTQGGGVSGAERTAAWRDRKRDDSPSSGDDDVTSQGRHGNADVTSPSRALAKERDEEKEVLEGSSVSLSSSGRSATDELTRQREKASEDDRRLCRLLAELAKDRNPKFKIKSEATWLREMRLLREKDNNTPVEAEALIRWTFTANTRDSEFWAGTIQSPANLREHFAQMWGKMHTAPLKSVAPESSAAFLTRRSAA